MNPWTLAAIVIFVYMNLGFIFSLTFKRNDVADMMWGPGFLLTALALNQGLTVRTSLILAATALWSVRLTGYVMYRNLGHTEDWRYKAWRDAWGKYFLIRSYFQVWILQGVLMYAIFYPIGVQMLNPNAELNPVYFVGLALWLFGLSLRRSAMINCAASKRSPRAKVNLCGPGFGPSRVTRIILAKRRCGGVLLLRRSICPTDCTRRFRRC